MHVCTGCSGDLVTRQGQTVDCANGDGAAIERRRPHDTPLNCCIERTKTRFARTKWRKDFTRGPNVYSRCCSVELDLPSWAQDHPTNRRATDPAPLASPASPLEGVIFLDEEAHQKWLADVTHWRAERRIAFGYDPLGMRYASNGRSRALSAQMMVHDRYFYDPSPGVHVDRYLDDLEKRYAHRCSAHLGDLSQLVIDNRNQQDMVRRCPAARRREQVVADFHRRGVRFSFPDDVDRARGIRDGWPQATAES